METNFKSGGSMQLTREPALPSKCINCGFSADGRKEFLDCNVSEDYYGAIVFCTDCVHEWAKGMGYVTPDEVIVALKERDDSVAAFVLMKEKLEALQNVLRTNGVTDFDAFIDYYANLSDVADVATDETESRDSVSEESSDRPDESPSKF